jgi:sec-independent protein translocase protein TatB
MGGLDPAKILIVLLLAVIVLGPERLPKAARQLGSAWRELTKLRDKLEAEVRSAMPDLDLPKIPALPARGLTGYLGGMMLSGSGSAGAASAGAATDEAAEAAGMTPMLGATRDDGIDLLDGGRPGSRPATEIRSGRSPRGTSEWRTSAFEAVPEHSELPAGWNAIGASGPGYASGSMLAPVPSSSASGTLSMEASLSFDEPSWN